MIRLDLIVAKGPQHPHPSETQDHFLTQSIVAVAAIEVIGECTIPGQVVLQGGIQEIHRHGMPEHPAHHVAPGTYLHGAALDGDRDARRHRLQHLLWNPYHRALRLITSSIQALAKVPTAVQERNGYHGEP